MDIPTTYNAKPELPPIFNSNPRLVPPEYISSGGVCHYRESNLTDDIINTIILLEDSGTKTCLV
jgi:hypothetical protein